MSDSREKFEMWAAFELMEHDFEMGEHGEYLDDFLQQSWLGWNAARAQDGGEVEPFGAESAYQTAKKSILTGSNMIISCDLVRELVEALRNSESQQPSAVVQESAACVSPAPHYETQRGLSCKSDTQSTVVPDWVKRSDRLPTVENADCNSAVWVSDCAFNRPKYAQKLVHYETVESVEEYTHWMETGIKRPLPPKQDPLN
jgi:hypothetical protein